MKYVWDPPPSSRQWVVNTLSFPARSNSLTHPRSPTFSLKSIDNTTSSLKIHPFALSHTFGAFAMAEGTPSLKGFVFIFYRWGRGNGRQNTNIHSFLCVPCRTLLRACATSPRTPLCSRHSLAPSPALRERARARAREIEIGRDRER